MAKFHLMGKTLDLERIEGRYAAFVKVPYSLCVRMSKKIAEDGYGVVKVNGTPISQGKTFEIDTFIKLHCMLIPVGEVANEFDMEYSVSFSGFKAIDGSSFKDASFKFRTLPRRKKDDSHEEAEAVALKAAREGMVLLKNEGAILPLGKEDKINVFGSDQFIFRNTATGAGLINPRWQANFEQGINEHGTLKINENLSKCFRNLQNDMPSQEVLDEARRYSDVAVMVLSRASGEFLDNKPIKGHYYLSDKEMALLKEVSAYPKSILILNTGYPIEMRRIKELGINSIIHTGFAGMLSGYALAEILDGRCNPSGKTPDSWAYDYYDHPSSKNFINLQEDERVPGEKECGVHLYYEEDIYVGYRYFDTFDKDVAYSFGHGLSYTEFRIESSFDERSLSIKSEVENLGKKEGKEVVQAYVSLPQGNISKAKRVLVAFTKTKSLKPGEKETVSLAIDKLDFASFDEIEGAYILEPGEYSVYVGNSLSNAKLVASFLIKRKEVLKKVPRLCRPVDEFPRLSLNNPFIDERSGLVPLEERIKTHSKAREFNPPPLAKGRKVNYGELRKDPTLLDDFVSGFSPKQLCYLNVSKGADWYLPWGDGSAGAIRRIKGLPKIKCSDGNTGLNIFKKNIGFPSSATIASSFNKDLAYEVGRTIAKESRENGILINLGPAMNIHRNILCGRQPEYFSEDPYLSGLMAGNHAKGLEEGGVGATYKHMFANNSETSRKGSESIVSEQALRELYFKTFEIAFRVQKPSCVMTSYNSLNGIYPAQNSELLEDLLRKEWGFEGFVMTDWCSYDTIDPISIVNAGTSFLTEGGRKYAKIVYKAYKEGKIPLGVLQDNAKRLIKVVLDLENRHVED